MSSMNQQPENERCCKEQERTALQGALNIFFEQFQLSDAREILWNWLTAALGSEHPLFETARDRANLIFFYEQLELLLEATYACKTIPSPGEPTGEEKGC